jgi:hypothetical protein
VTAKSILVNAMPAPEERYVYVENQERDYEHCLIGELDSVIMVRADSRSALAYATNGRGGRIYDYDIEKVKYHRPSIIRLIDPDDRLKQKAIEALEKRKRKSLFRWLREKVNVEKSANDSQGNTK